MIIALTWLWQGLVLAGLTVLLLRALPHLNAATRHAMWWAALVAVLSIPLVLAAQAPRDAVPGGAPAPAMDRLAPALALPAAPDWVGVLFGSAWMLAALGGLVRVAHGCRVVGTLRRTSLPFGTRERRLPLWSEARACARRPAELRISDDLAGACALGFRRPVILVGRTLAERLDDVALDQVVMHEYAHLARYDDWLQLFQATARAVAGLHPAVWWLCRRIDLDREAACDDVVVARTGAARQYASALLEAAVAAGPRPADLALAPRATLRTSALRRRVARLLDPARAPGTRATPVAAVGLVLPVIAILAGPRVAPVVAFVHAVEQRLPVGRNAADDRRLPVPPEALSAREGVPSTMRVRASGQASSRVSRAPERPRVASPGPHELLFMSQASREPTTGLPAVAPVAIESRRLFERVDVRLLLAPPPATMNGLSLRSPSAAASREVRTRSSFDAARNAASAVASGAERGGVAMGRAFARTRGAVAGRF